MNKGNQVLSGTDGMAWLNGEELLELNGIEAKITGEFEDVNFCGDYATYKRYIGWTGEGTLKFKKVKSRGARLMADAFKTGVMPDIKIISKLTNKQTGKSERAALMGVVFSEFTIASFENRALVEEELPFTFSGYDPIELI